MPFATHEAGADHSHLHIVRRPEERRTLLLARFGPAPQPFASMVVPLTPGPGHLADARGFAGIAFDARGTGRYLLLLDGYGGGSFRAPFAAGTELTPVRIPFEAFRGADPDARVDPARLRALVIRLEGEPGGEAILELANLRFYR